MVAQDSADETATEMQPPGREVEAQRSARSRPGSSVHQDRNAYYLPEYLFEDQQHRQSFSSGNTALDNCSLHQDITIVRERIFALAFFPDNIFRFPLSRE